MIYTGIALILIASYILYLYFIYRFRVSIKDLKISENSKYRFVVLSDIHIGILKHPTFLQKIVRMTNQLKDIDAVFILGDMFYKIDESEIPSSLSALKDLKCKTYFVFGNHDYDTYTQTANLYKKIETELKKYGIEILKNSCITHGDIRIFGLDDLVEGVPEILEIKDGDIVLAHNPDTVFLYENYVKNTITISGHTHCGQIRIPFVYKKMIPIRGRWYRQGPYHLSNGNILIISHGLGETHVPLRFLVKPEILILNI